MMTINRDFLSIKAHYFILNSAQACYINYLAVVGHQAGISVGDIGIILGIAPLAAAVFKPLAGMIADKMRNITAVIMTCEILLLVFCWGVFLTPQLSTTEQEFVSRNFSTCPATLSLAGSIPFKKGSQCNLNCGDVSKRSFKLIQDESTDCSMSCSVECSSNVAHLYTSGLLLYAVSVTITFALGSTLYSVTDAACYETLGVDHGYLFGQQRLWGTLSWGITSPLVGYLIDAVPDSDMRKFLPAIIGFTVLIVLNNVLLLFTPRFITPTTTEHFFEDLKTIYRNARVIMFTFRDPWYALLIDVVGGGAFPLFYVSLTGFANISALAGTAGTMQCLFGAVYEGIGVSIGNFVCGRFIDMYGVRAAFQIMGLIALACVPFCALS
ncbi:uncharacterized protein LOC111260351 isoform X2 [Varroa jacobsoni]|uniref:uncharacterized protein LOC111260351 isoform X2 n=1 Tax=Varroa jacobsoni TaxID=62625 RepID=UPI000BF8A65D|nr:uncharacterized protein LOC111260351 isoform X2 [Varroa jacobsoni]